MTATIPDPMSWRQLRFWQSWLVCLFVCSWVSLFPLLSCSVFFRRLHQTQNTRRPIPPHVDVWCLRCLRTRFHSRSHVSWPSKTWLPTCAEPLVVKKVGVLSSLYRGLYSERSTKRQPTMSNAWRTRSLPGKHGLGSSPVAYTTFSKKEFTSEPAGPSRAGIRSGLNENSQTRLWKTRLSKSRLFDRGTTIPNRNLWTLRLNTQKLFLVHSQSTSVSKSKQYS